MALLRESGTNTDTEINLQAVIGQNGESGIEHEDLLSAFAQATLNTDEATLITVRSALRATIGEAGLVDAAGVIANFEATVKIADATGLQPSEALLAKTEEARELLDLSGISGMRSE